MSNQIIPFEFSGFEVRTLLLNGEPWFIAKDIAETLGYSDTDKATRTHCKAIKSYPAELAGQVRHIQIIPERDVYRLIMRSKLPAAERFEEWVVGEVLPAIRKTGSYDLSIPKTLPEALRAYAGALEAKERLELQVAEQQPKVDFADAVMGSEDLISIGEAAKVLGLPFGRTTLFRKLREKKILMANNVPYQEYVDRGYFRVIESKWNHPESGEHITLTTRVFQVGLDYLRKLFMEESK